MPTEEKAASDYTEYVKKRASVVGRREFSDSLFNSLILQSSVGRGLGNTPEGPPPTPSGEYGVLTGFDYPDKVLWYPNFGDPGDFTVEFFFKCWDVNEFQRLCYLFIPGSDAIRLNINEGTLSIVSYHNINGIISKSITSVTPNTWYHVAITRSGSNFYASINGSTFEVDLQLVDLTNAELYIGGTDDGDESYPFYSGSISNFRISGPLYTPGTYTIPSLPLSASGARLLLLAKPGAEFADSTGTYVSEYSCGWEAGPIPSIPQPRTDYGVLTGFSSDNVMTYPGFGISGDFTMECFFKSSDPANADYEPICFFENDGEAPYIGILLDYGFIKIRTDSSEDTIPIAQIEANTWYHIALTRSGTDFYTSINGQTSLNIDIIDTNISNVDFYIGWYGSTEDYLFSGSISNLRISSVAKYTENYTVPTIPMEPSETDLLLLLAKPDAPFADTVLSPRTPKVSETNCGWAPGPIDLPTTDYGVLTGFDTSSLYYDSFSLPQSFTVEFFFKANTFSNSPYLFTVRNADLSTYFSGYVSSYGDITVENTGFESDNNLSGTIGYASLNTWYHYALTREGSNWYLSVNGTTSACGTGSIAFNSQQLIIGDYESDGTFNKLFGSISNFRISSVAKYTNPTLGYTVPSVPLQSESTDLLLLLAKPDAPFADTIFLNSERTPKEPTDTCKWGPGPIVAPITNYGVLTGFDTSSLYYNSFSLPQSFTVELFFNASDFSFGNYLFTFADTSYYFTGYCIQSGMFFESDELELNDTSIGNININTGTWYHTALTRDGSNWYASINGNTVSYGVGSQTFDSMSLIIGGFEKEVSSTNLRGSISNFRISNYARYTTNYYQVPSVPMTPASTDLLLLLAQPNAKFVDSSSYNRTPETTCEWGPGEPIVV
jgi:hypothetical protein